MGDWISVKERLPKQDESVLACVNNHYIEAYISGVDWYYDECIFDHGCNDLRFCEHCSAKINTVTHWKPLPKPPKG